MSLPVTYSLLSAGSGDVFRDLLVTYHVGLGADRLKAALPGVVILRCVAPGMKALYSRVDKARGFLGYAETIALAASEARQPDEFWNVRRVVLLGFSEGCQGVRAHLRAGAKPYCVAALDGTHADLPMQPSQIDPWADIFARARRGDPNSHFIATHTRIKTEPAYASTRAVLERVTGWELLGDAVRVTRQANAVVYSYVGTDAPAHIDQQQSVLPMLLADEVSERLRRDEEAGVSA